MASSLLDGAREGAAPLVIQIHLVAGDDDDPEGEVTVSTAVSLSSRASGWDTLLVDAVAAQAGEGARRLCDQLAVQPAIASSTFVPLASVIPDLGSKY
jgi:hypothetical protein